MDQHIDYAVLMPFLNRGSWEHQGMCLNRRLIPSQDWGMPLIGYGEDSPNTVYYIVKETLKVAETTHEFVEEAAIRNLKARPDRPAWEVDMVDWEGAKRPLLSRRGDELTASDLLDPDFMQFGHEQLDSEEIVVAIPTRSFMLACTPDMAPGLAKVAQNQYLAAAEAQRDALSEYLFTVVDGQVTGITKTAAKALAKPDESAEDE